MTYIGYIPLAGWTVWSTKGTETTDAAIANFIHSSCTLISYVTRWPEVFLHVIDTKPTNVPHTLLTVFSSSARHHISTSQVHNNNLHRSLNRITLPTFQPPSIQYNCVSFINRGLQAPTLPWLRFHPHLQRTVSATPPGPRSSHRPKLARPRIYSTRTL